MRQGRTLGPVKLFEIKDEFYVLDGNHRIAAAKELGHDEILAHIEEFIPSKTPFKTSCIANGRNLPTAPDCRLKST